MIGRVAFLWRYDRVTCWRFYTLETIILHGPGEHGGRYNIGWALIARVIVLGWTSKWRFIRWRLLFFMAQSGLPLHAHEKALPYHVARGDVAFVDGIRANTLNVSISRRSDIPVRHKVSLFQSRAC